MTQNKRILLCGHSLFISCVQACMESEQGLVLQQVDSQPDHIWGRILSWRPDVLILETGQLESALSVSLRHDFPQIKVIGLDIEDNRLLVFSGSASSMTTLKDLPGWIDS